ncbi:MAG: DUF1538 domain-containing protein [Lachnospiraceae bacterium]|nr:DUF1538 domain-containing protein [Lachnospiraceae bacterium]
MAKYTREEFEVLKQQELKKQKVLFEEFKRLTHKQFRESFESVLPIFVIVIGLSLVLAPVPSGTMLCFIASALLLIIGSAFFNMGADFSMSPIGEKVGAAIVKSRKLHVIVIVGLLLGFAVTIAEPDLQVLATQVPSIPEKALIYGVATGVGVFLVIALLRMFFKVPLNRLLIIFYAVVLVLSFFVPKGYRTISFDAGGVTTGPMTVPFIMALGVGVAAVRNDRHAEDDSFGLVALCSIGPILTVMILGILPSTGVIPELAGSASAEAAKTMEMEAASAPAIPDVATSIELAKLYYEGLPYYLKEMLSSLLPIVGAFVIFQIIALKIKARQLVKIVRGLVYTYVGLVLFMTGVNLGFLPTGYYLGEILAGGGNPWIIVPAAMVMGYVCVKAEPAVAVLNRQVEDMTDGAISERLMGTSLSIGVAISLGLSMVRVLTGISILWFIVPGYLIAIIISFFVPKIYTAIAFDSGGVASGPMTAAFLLPFAQGACACLGGNVATDAFGVVAMVAMTPLITIQGLGLMAAFKKKKKKVPVPTEPVFEDDMIIEL